MTVGQTNCSHDVIHPFHFNLLEKLIQFYVTQLTLVVKNLQAKEGNTEDVGSIPESRRCPGGGHSNPV